MFPYELESSSGHLWTGQSLKYYSNLINAVYSRCLSKTYLLLCETHEEILESSIGNPCSASFFLPDAIS